MTGEFQLLIVNFHYIREVKPHNGIYPVTPTGFRNQLDVLGKKFDFVSQADIVTGLASGFKKGSYCLITFDDGLAEQETAIEILGSKGIPAVFYVPVAPYVTNTTLAVHKLHYIRSVASEKDFLSLVYQHSSIQNLDRHSKQARIQYKYDAPEVADVKFYLNFVLTPVESDRLINTIFNNVIRDEAEFTKRLYFSRDKLKAIARAGMLGSHGTDHRPLATLPTAEMKNDILHSISFLQDLTGSQVTSFSYPYGSTSAVDDRAVVELNSTNVEFALTMFRGINTQADLANPYLLKRIDTNDAPGGAKPLKELFA